MKIGLFVTCLVDLMRPRIGFAALELLQAAGCEVIVPEAQTCCGQPGYNSGERQSAIALARKAAREFADCDYVVAPSGSCVESIDRKVCVPAPQALSAVAPNDQPSLPLVSVPTSVSPSSP